MFERFTERARKVMALADQEAQRLNHEYMGTAHILLGLVKEGAGVGANVLRRLDVDLRKVRVEVQKLVESAPNMVTMGKLPQTPRSKKVIEYAIEEARGLNQHYVGTEHLLLGLLRDRDTVAGQVLLNLGLDLDETRNEVLKFVDEKPEYQDDDNAPAPAPPKYQPTDEFDEEIKQFGDDPQVKWLIAQIGAKRDEMDECVRLGQYERAAELRDERDTLRFELDDLFKELAGEADDENQPNSE